MLTTTATGPEEAGVVVWANAADVAVAPSAAARIVLTIIDFSLLDGAIVIRRSGAVRPEPG
jgi:hypothetical protein